jgi:hypothetical protein
MSWLSQPTRAGRFPSEISWTSKTSSYLRVASGYSLDSSASILMLWMQSCRAREVEVKNSRRKFVSTLVQSPCVGPLAGRSHNQSTTSCRRQLFLVQRPPNFIQWSDLSPQPRLTFGEGYHCSFWIPCQEALTREPSQQCTPLLVSAGALEAAYRRLRLYSAPRDAEVAP